MPAPDYTSFLSPIPAEHIRASNSPRASDRCQPARKLDELLALPITTENGNLTRSACTPAHLTSCPSSLR
jgi:hypothetical protein